MWTALGLSVYKRAVENDHPDGLSVLALCIFLLNFIIFLPVILYVGFNARPTELDWLPAILSVP